MKPETALNRLISADIVGVPQDRQPITLTESFEETLEQKRHSKERKSQQQLLKSLQREDDRQVLQPMLNNGPAGEEIIINYLALRQQTDTIPSDVLATMAILVDQIRNPPPAEGVPESFIPIRGDRLPIALHLYHRAIVYVWRHDCEPCDVMVQTLNNIFEEPPDDIALFAVYGPDHPEILQRRYQVPAGPVTLFAIDGEVDSRLYGAYGPAAVKSEVETIRELTKET